MSAPEDPTTRTRLPEEDYRSRPPRSRPPLVNALALLTIVVLLAVAVVIIRSGHHGSAPSTGSTGATLPPAVSTALPPGGGGGDVATGYADTVDGARSAATNYVVALGADTMVDTGRRHAVIAAIADPASTAALQTQFDTITAAERQQWGVDADGHTAGGFTFVSRMSAMGVSTDAYAPGRATVDVWTVRLIGLVATPGSNGVPDKPITEVWETHRVVLNWVGGDWKAVSIATTDGPVPVSGVQAASPLAVIGGALQQYGGFRYGA